MKRYVTKVIQSPGKWVAVGDKEFYGRSKWERNYGRYLDFQKQNKLIQDWEHEPHTFWFEGIKRGVVSFLPDFKVSTLKNTHFWVEVKGYYDKKTLTKLKRMAKYYPKETLVVIDKEWFLANNRKLRGLVKGWE